MEEVVFKVVCDYEIGQGDVVFKTVESAFEYVESQLGDRFEQALEDVAFYVKELDLK